MENNYAVKTQELSMNYGSLKALDNLSLDLEPDKIYGLLGRNGAGKTTLLNILTARIFETSGKAYVFGERAYENIGLLKQICYIEEKGFYDSAVRISQVLKLASGLYPNWDNDYAYRLLELFELDERKKYKQLSRGMESSLGLVIGLASRAPLTIFDEPSLGLDAVIRERFYDAVIEDYSEYPRTIIISTHLIDEVSRLFEDVIIIDGGRLLLQANGTELKEKAYYISGKEEAVRAAANKTIIMKEENFGGTLIQSVYAKNGVNPAPGTDVQQIPLQKLFTLLIDPETQARLRKGGVLK
jgi:ABC-2 type transport system ATP-binding protein